MITFSGDELSAWIALLFYPLTRVLALFAVAPLFSNVGVPRTTRLVAGIVITLGILPAIPSPPAVDINSAMGLWMIAREMSVGIAMGFALRIVFAAFSMAGEQMGFQMGLGFALFYDPQNTSQTPILSAFITLIATLMFVAINGHLMVIATLAQSFHAIPISPVPMPSDAWLGLVLLAGQIFSAGLLMSLPVTLTLVITNLSLGVLSKAAPQLNLFAIGFPITMMAGLLVLGLSISYMATPMLALFELGLQHMLPATR